MFKSQTEHGKLRKDLVHYKAVFVEKCQQLVDGDIEIHLQHQCCMDGKVLTWATEAELTAAVDWYGIDILVSRNSLFYERIEFPGKRNDSYCSSRPVGLELSRKRYVQVQSFKNFIMYILDTERHYDSEVYVER